MCDKSAVQPASPVPAAHILPREPDALRYRGQVLFDVGGAALPVPPGWVRAGDGTTVHYRPPGEGVAPCGVDVEDASVLAYNDIVNSAQCGVCRTYVARPSDKPGGPALAS